MRCASVIRGPGSWCSRSTRTRSTRSRCCPRARPATATCSRTTSPRAASWSTRSARWPPAAPPSTRPSSRRWWLPWSPTGGLAPAEEELLGMVAEGRTIKAIAAVRQVPPEAVAADVEAVFVKLAQGVSAGSDSALRRLRLLHQAIVDREEQGETLSRLLPSGLADQAQAGTAGHRRDRASGGDRPDERHPVLFDHRRARRPEPARRAAQHPPGRHEPGHPGRGRHRHAVRRRRGDGGLRRPVPAARPRRPRGGRRAGHARPAGRRSTAAGRPSGLPPFGLGLGLSTGEAAAALLGSAEQLEYTLVGDTVNLSQRLQQLADPGETVLSEATFKALSTQVPAIALGAQQVKGREALRSSPTRSTGWGDDDAEQSRRWPCAACARRSRPRTRRSARCAG